MKADGTNHTVSGWLGLEEQRLAHSRASWWASHRFWMRKSALRPWSQRLPNHKLHSADFLGFPIRKTVRPEGAHPLLAPTPNFSADMWLLLSLWSLWVILRLHVNGLMQGQAAFEWSILKIRFPRFTQRYTYCPCHSSIIFFPLEYHKSKFFSCPQGEQLQQLWSLKLLFFKVFFRE